jgi:hypothetical protein
VFHEEINTVAALEFNAFVNHGNGLLAFKGKIPDRQLTCQALFVCGFE